MEMDPQAPFQLNALASCWEPTTKCSSCYFRVSSSTTSNKRNLSAFAPLFEPGSPWFSRAGLLSPKSTCEVTAASGANIVHSSSGKIGLKIEKQDTSTSSSAASNDVTCRAASSPPTKKHIKSYAKVALNILKPDVSTSSSDDTCTTVPPPLTIDNRKSYAQALLNSKKQHITTSPLKNSNDCTAEKSSSTKSYGKSYAQAVLSTFKPPSALSNDCTAAKSSSTKYYEKSYAQAVLSTFKPPLALTPMSSQRSSELSRTVKEEMPTCKRPLTPPPTVCELASKASSTQRNSGTCNQLQRSGKEDGTTGKPALTPLPTVYELASKGSSTQRTSDICDELQRSGKVDVPTVKLHLEQPPAACEVVIEGSSDIKCRTGMLESLPTPVQKRSVYTPQTQQKRNPLNGINNRRPTSSIPTPKTPQKRNPSNEYNNQRPTSSTTTQSEEDVPSGNDKKYINGVIFSWERLDVTWCSCNCAKMSQVERALITRHWNLRKVKTHKVYERMVKFSNGDITRQTLTVSQSASAQRASREVLSNAKRLDRGVSFVGVFDINGTRRYTQYNVYKSVQALFKEPVEEFRRHAD